MKRSGLGAAFLAAATIVAGVIPGTTGVAHAATTPAVSVGDLQVVETDVGQGAVTVPVTLDVPAPATVKVKLKIAGGTAAKKTDYKGAPTVATIKKGQAAGFAKVQLVGDGAIEPTETLNLQVASVTGATVSDSTGVLTMTDNDANGVAAKPEVRVGRPTIWEGNKGVRSITVPLTLSRPSTGAVTLGFADQCRGEAISFPPGIVAKTVTVTTVGDTADAADRVLKNALGLVGGAATVPALTGESVVRDDDGAPAGMPVGGVVRASLQTGGTEPRYPNFTTSDPRWVYPESTDASISSGGRYVAFTSNAYNLVDCDTNDQADVFVKDLVTGVIERVNVSDSGAQANGYSGNAEISPDGRYVVFDSDATNLVPNDVNGWADAFIYDRTTHTTRKLVNVTSFHRGSSYASISADNRYVAFESSEPLAGDADTCLPGSVPDINGECNYYDVYVLDRTTNTIRLVSNGQNGAPTIADFPVISADGSSIAYQSDKPYVTNLATGATESVFVTSSEQPATGTVNATIPLAISGDGTKVGFVAQACNLGVTCPVNRPADVHAYLRDRTAGTTTVMTTAANGTPLTGISPMGGGIAISANGRYFLFGHSEQTLTPPACHIPVIGPLAGGTYTYERDLVAGGLTPVGVNAAGLCPTAPGDSDARIMTPNAVSADGSYVAFMSSGSYLVPDDTNGITEVFVKRLR